MRRTQFLSFAAMVAFIVGTTALFVPSFLLASKGIVGNPVAAIWMREVGAMLVSVGAMAWCVRKHPPSPTLRIFLWGNAAFQLLLLPIEIVAYVEGTIPLVAGIVPNSALHVMLFIGFATFVREISAQLNLSVTTHPKGESNG